MKGFLIILGIIIVIVVTAALISKVYNAKSLEEVYDDKGSKDELFFDKCPDQEYVNCMPPIEDDQNKKYCSKEGRDWLTNNCSTKFAF